MKKKTIITSLLFLSCLFFNLPAKSQTLLTPEELVKIHLQKDNDQVTTELSDKGYSKSNYWETKKSGEAEFTWSFSAHGGESVDFEIRKFIDTSGKARTLYWIMNKYQYKEFMANLLKAKFLFAEITITDNVTYAAFKKGDKTILIRERQVAGVNDAGGAYYEIKLE